MEGADLASSSRPFALFWLLLVFWAIAWIAFTYTFLPDIYFYSYYAVDYSFGFIRRGLAGEVARLFPEDRYFTGLIILRWVSTAIFTIGLGAIMWTILRGQERSDRRIILAILIPLLPCAFTYGLLSPRPDLFGATALMAFMVAVKSARSNRAIIIAGALYGVATAILTLAHEAIPFLFSLGVLVTLIVLAHQRAETTLRWSAALAISPGLLVALAIALFGQRGIGKQICDRVPHGPVNHPLAGNRDLTMMDVLGGYRFDVDYHDWFCRCIAQFFDHNTLDAARFVNSIDLTARIGAVGLGLIFLALTIITISHISGVRFSRMLVLLKRKWLWVLLGFAIVSPMFVLGADWTRWCVMISLDIGFVFALFASEQREASEPFTFTPRTALLVGTLIIVGPFGCVPGLGFPIELII